jgi:hypothetical protein
MRLFFLRPSRLRLGLMGLCCGWRKGGWGERIQALPTEWRQSDLPDAGKSHRGPMQSGATTRGSVALAATHLPRGEGVVLNQDDEGTTAMIKCKEQRPTTRGRKLKHDFDPPDEYISQSDLIYDGWEEDDPADAPINLWREEEVIKARQCKKCRAKFIGRLSVCPHCTNPNTTL